MRIIYRLHARQQMAERGFTPADVREALITGTIVERKHHAGRPFPTRLLLRWSGERPLHVLVADDPTGVHYVITVYEPTLDRWQQDFCTRRERP